MGLGRVLCGVGPVLDALAAGRSVVGDAVGVVGVDCPGTGATRCPRPLALGELAD
ncbi:hypothetical protein ABZY57_09000 [Streptomyces sp. NPDC006450]|uniref:hypothetical protein n=1 Tax=Streptomyces sp. NPDC006450 TaxID=3155458 RepID=UPI0033A88FCA